MLIISLCFFKGIDECNGDHECDHHCTNVNGTFICSCDFGYELKSDNRTCEGLVIIAVMPHANMYLYMCIYYIII